jgi:hypothetical protein
MKLLPLLLVGLIVVLGTAPTVAAQEDATPSLVLPSLDPPTEDGYLGELTENTDRQDSIANPYGRFGNPYAPNGINNPDSASGSPDSPSSATNPYATDPPLIIGSDGRYLGRLSANPYLRDSVTNPFGRYGSTFSPDSITNPFGRYGSSYSPLSPTNPYATRPPRIIDPE